LAVYLALARIVTADASDASSPPPLVIGAPKRARRTRHAQ
jgi:hypothetical protein